ncbi:MAG: peptidylprolyl isomerase [Actinobacteria bacterium]|nr:peptidylprolyl isomerase [Actinomycetota bacterium]
MGKAQKRARKKEFRDQRLAEYAAGARRRRLAMFVAVAVALLALIAVAIGSGFVGGDEGDEDSPAAQGDTGTGDVACGGDDPPEAEPMQYDAAPEDQLERGVDYRAVVHTSCGDIEMDLLEKKAPATVSNFIFLANEGFYDGLSWHRVERNTVVQTGDPNGINGEEPDGPGYGIKDEPPKASSEYVYGVVGMANAGPGTAGSQWFIVTFKDGPAGYQPLYAIFGKVDEGSYETLEKIDKLPTKGGNDAVQAVQPQTPVFIESIEILES